MGNLKELLLEAKDKCFLSRDVTSDDFTETCEIGTDVDTSGEVEFEDDDDE